MKKSVENRIYHFAHSEYFDAVEDWFHEMINENDIRTRAIDPNKDPHKISKLVGGTETLLSVIQQLENMRER